MKTGRFSGNNDQGKQPQKAMVQIRPGLTINLVINSNTFREVNDIRTSTIYDQEGRKLVVAQTDPFLLSDTLGKTITVSFLVREKEGPVRYGFLAKIVDIIREYPLNPFQKVPAVVLVQRSKVGPYNLRMFYRVQPPHDFGLEMFLTEVPVSIIDISIGGAVVSSPRESLPNLQYEIGQLLPMHLIIDGERFDLQGRIKRLTAPVGQKERKNLLFLAMEFWDRTPELDRALGEKILNIQRELRARELGF